MGELVSETVRTHINKSFRSAFESSLLPAFQAGTTRMFAQIQGSFDAGIETLAAQTQNVLRVHNSEIEKLHVEVSSLNKAVSELTAVVNVLASNQNQFLKAAATASSESAAVPSAPAAQHTNDPMALLGLGRLIDAVHLALEMKSVSVLVKVLGQIRSPTQFIEACNNALGSGASDDQATMQAKQEVSLVLLCSVQQLSAGLSEVYPEEGVSKRQEWLKILITQFLDLHSDSALSAATASPEAHKMLTRESSKAVLRQVLGYIETAVKKFSPATGGSVSVSGDYPPLTQAEKLDFMMIKGIISSFVL